MHAYVYPDTFLLEPWHYIVPGTAVHKAVTLGSETVRPGIMCCYVPQSHESTGLNYAVVTIFSHLTN